MDGLVTHSAHFDRYVAPRGTPRGLLGRGWCVRAPALAIALVLAACVRFDLAQPQPYSVGYANDVLSAGYRHIENRHIEQVEMRDLALAALAGLNGIDKDLSVRAVGDDIVLTRTGTAVAAVPMPRNQEPRAWARASVAVIEAAREASPKVAEIPSEQLFEAVFDGAMAPLDSFSRYSSATEASDSRAVREGYGGIGMTVRMQEGAAEVLDVVPNAPAAQAGLEANDRIQGVDGTALTDWTQRQLIDNLRGPVGSSVRLQIYRPLDDTSFEVTLRRQRIVLPTVVSEWRDGVAIVKIASFNQNTGHAVARAVVRLNREHEGALRGVVLDLRSNPGGLLDQAVEVADVFLDDGEIVATRGRHPHSMQRFAASGADLTDGVPLVVLVNGSSASASEVVAAALQDSGRAVLIGTNSYGKGTVQTVLRLPNDGELTLTWSRLHAPSGYRLHGLGVLPSLCTHGENGDGGPEVLLDELRLGDNETVRALGEWRLESDGDPVTQERLRNTCPADNRAPDGDVQLATTLIQDDVLYAQALRIADTSLAER